MTFLLFLLLTCWQTANATEAFDAKFIDVPLDHFSYVTNKTFKLRYLVNKSHHVKGGPVFIYTGNEGDVTMFAQNCGFVLEVASEFNALVVFAEHRYYGQSMPFGNQSYSSAEKLGYLTTAQALADFVYVIEELKRTYLSTVISSDTYPFIAFGGSYGGMLAAWLRMKYPNSVIGAVASSAPVWLFEGLTPCESFYEIASNVFGHYGGEHCNKTIQSSWETIRNITRTDEGKAYISSQWKLCDPIKTSENVDKLIDWLGSIYVNLAMINYPYPTNFFMDLPAYPVKVFCDKLSSFKFADGKGLLDALGAAIQIYTNYTGKNECNNVNVTSQDMGEYAWDYQACTELIMPMCSTEKDMFESTAWSFQKYSDDCFKRFGVHAARPDWSVLEYGGKNLRYFSNIVFSNGLMDPWSSGCILHNISSSIVVINITDGAHHVDLRATHPADTNYVVQARNFHRNAIKRRDGPSKSTFQRLVAKFETTGSVNNLPTPVRQRNARSAENIAAVRVSVQENPRQHILQLEEGDEAKCLDFCLEMGNRVLNEVGFHKRILFSAESTFSTNGVVSSQHCRYWSEINPHFTISCRRQYFKKKNLNRNTYLEMLQHFLTDKLDELPLGYRKRMFFQQDGCPAHHAVTVRNWLNFEFNEHWIGRDGPILWPPRSPDLTILDFYLWGRLKQIV
ncbi:hypothetical protein NQ318_009763 [Aromia moschata]|uniref:Lysosomal Pro-X carboxypeptidase n=1 Tax=Aromia moschata TaxID=1265417 RepID=A0AAV8Y7U6_9CUCU|nr:hypothetical protein NQ318_009763 [Aromia moschata]